MPRPCLLSSLLFSEVPVSISGTSNLFCVLFEVGTDYQPPMFIFPHFYHLSSHWEDRQHVLKL